VHSPDLLEGKTLNFFPSSILSAFVRKSFNDKGPLAFVTTCTSVDSIEASRLHPLLLAYYRILRANRPLPHSLYWPLTPLSKLFLAPHPDMGVRLLAIHCYALQSGMCEAEQEKLERQVLGEICGVDCQIGCGQDVDGTLQESDGWLLPVLEIKRITDARNALIIEPQDFYSVGEGDLGPPLTPSDLSYAVRILMFWNLSPITLQPSHSERLWSSTSPISWSFGDRNISDFDADGHRGATFTSDPTFSASSDTTHIPTLIWKVTSSLPPRRNALPWVQKSNNNHTLSRHIP
jgi:hypothetical protein